MISAFWLARPREPTFLPRWKLQKNCQKKRSSLPFSATERSDTLARDSLIAKIRMLNEKPEIKTARQQNRRWQLALGGLVEQRFELA